MKMISSSAKQTSRTLTPIGVPQVVPTGSMV